MLIGIGADGPIRVGGSRSPAWGRSPVAASASRRCGTGCSTRRWSGGAVRDFEPERVVRAQGGPPARPVRPVRMAAADLAVQDAGEIGVDPAKAGVIFATGVGGFDTLAEQVGVYNEKGARRVSPRLVPMMMANAGAAGISMRLGWHGPSEVIVTACAAGTHAIAAAARLVAIGPL